MRVFTQRQNDVQARSWFPAARRSRTIRNPSTVGVDHAVDTSGAPAQSLAHDFGRLTRQVPGLAMRTLTVSDPGDLHEREADRAADAIMAGQDVRPGGLAQAVQPKLYRAILRPEDMVDSMDPPGVEEETAVQRSATSEASAPGAGFQQSLARSIDRGGEHLPVSTRSFMERRFGTDFSAVRVHHDEPASALANDINARAFTIGPNVFFARSQYQPESREGQHLLAHELAHVLQQSSHHVSRQIQRRSTCRSYNGYDSSINVHNYNCAGLAIRNYQFISPASAAYDAMAPNLNAPHTPRSGNCDPGEVKIWFWEYDIKLEDDQGTLLASPHRDFHVVGGRVDAQGNDPTNVYSKNGRRPVYGPGTGPGFRPPARDRATSNDRHETPGTTAQGRPVFKVRTNMSEDITCAGCYP